MATHAAIAPQTFSKNTPSSGSGVSSGEAVSRKSQFAKSSQQSFLKRQTSNLDYASGKVASKVESEANDLNPQGIKDEVNRKQQLAKSQHQARQIGTPLTMPQAPAKTDSPAEQQQPGKIASIKNAFQDAKSNIAKAKNDHYIRELNSKDGTYSTASAKDQTRKAVKKAAKAAMQRGAIYITNSIASAIDLGTGGVSLIINIVVHFFTLGWLNVEMIYGGFIMKDKSRFISDVSFDPIPVPLPKSMKRLVLIGAITAADMAVILAALIMFTFQLVLIMVWFSPLFLAGFALSNPSGFLGSVASIFSF